MDKIKGKVLPGGLLKLETDQISAAAHLSADRLIRGLEESLGGKTEVTRKNAHVHTHDHDHIQEGH